MENLMLNILLVEDDEVDVIELEDEDDAGENAEDEESDEDNESNDNDPYCGHEPVIATCKSLWTWSYCSPAYKATVYTSYCYTPKSSVSHCSSIETNFGGIFSGLRKLFGGWC